MLALVNTDTRMNLSNKAHTKLNHKIAPFRFEREESFWLNWGQEEIQKSYKIENKNEYVEEVS